MQLTDIGCEKVRTRSLWTKHGYSRVKPARTRRTCWEPRDQLLSYLGNSGLGWSQIVGKTNTVLISSCLSVCMSVSQWFQCHSGFGPILRIFNSCYLFARNSFYSLHHKITFYMWSLPCSESSNQQSFFGKSYNNNKNWIETACTEV